MRESRRLAGAMQKSNLHHRPQALTGGMTQYSCGRRKRCKECNRCASPLCDVYVVVLQLVLETVPGLVPGILLGPNQA